MQDPRRTTGVNYNVSGTDTTTGASYSSLFTHPHESYSLYLQMQALERENSGLRAKLDALTSTMEKQFTLSRISKVDVLSSKVTRIVEEEVERVTKQYKDALARKHIYKRRFLKIVSILKSVRDSLRLVLDVARLHQHPTLFQAVRNIEDSLMLSWPEEDISDCESVNLGPASAPQLPLILPIREVDDNNEHVSVASSHNSPRPNDDCQVPSYYGAVHIEQRTQAPARLPPIQKREQHVQVSVQPILQTELEKGNGKQDGHIYTPSSPLAKQSEQEARRQSCHEDGLSEGSYLANSSLLLALEKRVASEVADVFQSAYERHLRSTERSDSCESISVIEMPHPSSSGTNPESIKPQSSRNPESLSDVLVRHPTPSLATEQSSHISTPDVSSHSSLSHFPTTNIVAPSSIHSVVASDTASISAPILLPVSTLSSQSGESIEVLTAPNYSRSGQSMSLQAQSSEPINHKTSLPSLPSSAHQTQRPLTSVSSTSQSISINSFICGINEIVDDCSVASNAENPLVVFSPRAEEYITQVSSISANNHASASIPTDFVNSSHVPHALKMHGSRVALQAVAGSVESDMIVSDVNVMKQTARQQQIAATRLLESKGPPSSDIAETQAQDIESTESMGLIVDRSRAAAGVNRIGFSAYLSEVFIAHSGDMGITPDVADFCLSRPITADEEEVRHTDAPSARKDPSNAAVLTTAMLDQSLPVPEHLTRSQDGSTPLMQSSSLNN
ncbi:Hypothetical protein GLP15_4883 [Giardia lamblia P15]|uniref:Uncharacterized protein n=1 Tax=Giardia intestinalis (strain P15) TaxID=658858 RepID=E1F4S9_GIAIA|nr:Hypothetical protein GLP15_4883 [Giardia lamblia P15]